jgi:hypothetical protein
MTTSCMRVAKVVGTFVAGCLLIALSQPVSADTFWYISSIACDPVTGVCGWATGFLYTEESVAAAKQACRNRGGQHCKIAIPSFNSCGAVTDPLKGGYYGIGQTKALAESRAKHACQKDGGRDCKVIVALCSESGTLAAPTPSPIPPSPTPSPSPSPSPPACPPNTHPGLGGCYGY